MSASQHQLEPELLTPLPRPARMARRTWLILGLPVLVLGLLVAGLGLVLLVVVKSGDADLRALAEHGATTAGRLTRVWARTPPGGGLRLQAEYQFQAEGRTYTGTLDGAAPSARPGDPVTVTYLPGAPATHRVGPVTAATWKGRSGEYRTLAQALFILFGFLFVVVGLFALLPNYLSARRNVRLAREGVAAAATVVAVVPGGVRYRFEVPGRGEVTGAAPVIGVNGKRLEVGSTVTALYLPGRPRRFALYRELGDVEWPAA